MSTVFVAVVLSVKKICLTINLCLRLLTSTRWHQTCGKKELPHGMLNTREWEGVTIFLSLLLYIGQIEASTCPPRANPPGIWLFWKLVFKIPPYPGQNAVQMPHTRVHSGDQMPPPGGHFTGTKMTEGRRKRLQLSNKIFINITKTEKHG